MTTSRENIGTAHIVIRPSSGWAPLNLLELWNYRELLYFLTWRDIKVRYKQTVLGVCWALIQPLFMMIVFSLFFGRLAGIPSDGIPYPLFAFAALLPWQLFSRALTEASTSLVLNERLITKVYFPRILVPTAAVMASLVDFTIALILLLGLMLLYGMVPTAAVVWLPLYIMLAVCTALGAAFWLSALDARYRDIRYTLPFLTQLWLFITPVVYPASLVPAGWRLLYGLNPMSGVVEGFRWALLGRSATPEPLQFVSLVVSLGLLVGGIYYFKRMEQEIADVI